MFDAILIANRGEIACRVIRTAQRLGIRTVAVFSDADAGALHVALADEAVRIGPAPASESYLRGDRTIEAAERTGARAIHPGYGFLSENAGFADAVEAAGLTFIGPSADAIRAMGLKDAAKRLMQEAGVPVVPGYHGEEQDPAFLAAEAASIGYPVLIKARAGGGGKGMRRVDDPADFNANLEGARREGEASFGDPHCLIERYVEKPRHIEIQVFGDGHGNVVHLFERDCSLQRRHQKVIEEAPAPGMTTAMRAAMGDAAVRAAKAVRYSGAGTVEFIVDASNGLRPDRFWFMEMNTRLQVEHPVTEAITGLDLVEWQLRVASGEALPFKQEDLAIRGHAFEARIYAEDASRGFLPATGRITHLRFSQKGVRVDTGVREGDEITPHYDPMIAKLIVHGENRPHALASLRVALGQTRIAGTVTNVAFLDALAAHPAFASGDVDTGLIGREGDRLTAGRAAPMTAVAVAALAQLGYLDAGRVSRDDPVSARQDDKLGRDERAGPWLDDPWTSLRGFRAWGRAEQTVRLRGEGARGQGGLSGGERLDVRVADCGNDRFIVSSGSDSLSLSLMRAAPATSVTQDAGSDKTVRLCVDGHVVRAALAREQEASTVFLDGFAHRFERFIAQVHAGDADAGDRIAAPMPGVVKLVTVAVGQRVEKNEALIVLEAMKMEHTLRSPRDGIVAELTAGEGDQVENGAVLAVLTPAGDPA